MPVPLRALIFATVLVPASALSLRVYLKERPLSSKRSESIISTENISPSCEASSSIKVVNPHNHISMRDSYTIHLSKHETRGLSDEQILARFLKGFYGGWIFTPERYFLTFLSLFGLKFVPVGFTGIETQDPGLGSPLKLSQVSLPPKHSILIYGNFMLLDKSILSNSDRARKSFEKSASSFVDIAYGDDRRGFAGIHRFELTRYSGEEEPGAALCYSSITCNPTVNKPVLPHFVYLFHKVYAKSLFRDGVASVLGSQVQR